MEFFTANDLTLKGRDITQEVIKLFERFLHLHFTDADTFFEEGIHTIHENVGHWQDIEYHNSIYRQVENRAYPINFENYQGFTCEAMYFIARYFNGLLLAYYAENELDDFKRKSHILVEMLHSRAWIESYYGELEKAHECFVEAVKVMIEHLPREEWRSYIFEELGQLTQLLQEKNNNPELFELLHGQIHQLVTTDLD